MKRFVKIITMISSVLMAASCFGIDENDYKELAPIDFNEVSSVIDVDLGQELVYDKLQVTSDKPVEFQWAYGPKKISSSGNEKSICPSPYLKLKSAIITFLLINFLNYYNIKFYAVKYFYFTFKTFFKKIKVTYKVTY